MNIMTPDFFVGVIVGALLTFVAVLMFVMVDRLQRRYRTIRREVRIWRHLRDNELRVKSGLPPKPMPLGMDSVDPDDAP